MFRNTSLSWSIVEFESNMMKIQLHFDNAIEISAGDGNDRLSVRFLKSKYLVSEDGNARPSSNPIYVDLPLQM